MHLPLSLISLCCLLVLQTTQPATTQPAVATTAPARPQTMTRLTYRFFSPQVKPGSFEAQPRTIYRWGSYHMRVEEAPDRERSVHGLIIASNRHSWMANQFNKTAMHIYDDGPSYESHAPILGEVPRDHLLWKLEFGEELAFMQANGKKSPEPMLREGVACDSYKLDSDLGSIELLVRRDLSVPVMLNVNLAGREPLQIVYDQYDAYLEPKPELFQVPAGYIVRDAKRSVNQR